MNYGCLTGQNPCRYGRKSMQAYPCNKCNRWKIPKGIKPSRWKPTSQKGKSMQSKLKPVGSLRCPLMRPNSCEIFAQMASSPEPKRDIPERRLAMKHKVEKWICQECEWSERPCVLTCTDEPCEDPPKYC